MTTQRIGMPLVQPAFVMMLNQPILCHFDERQRGEIFVIAEDKISPCGRNDKGEEVEMIARENYHISGATCLCHDAGPAHPLSFRRAPARRNLHSFPAPLSASPTSYSYENVVNAQAAMETKL